VREKREKEKVVAGFIGYHVSSEETRERTAHPLEKDKENHLFSSTVKDVEGGSKGGQERLTMRRGEKTCLQIQGEDEKSTGQSRGTVPEKHQKGRKGTMLTAPHEDS